MTRNLPRLPLANALHKGELHIAGDLSDMLSELRILLPGAQMLTAFLIILPFSTGARQHRDLEICLFSNIRFCADQPGAAERARHPAPPDAPPDQP